MHSYKVTWHLAKNTEITGTETVCAADDDHAQDLARHNVWQRFDRRVQHSHILVDSVALIVGVAA